jgi:hypothetical protein
VALDVDKLVLASAVARNAGASAGRATRVAVATSLMPNLDTVGTAVVASAIGGRGARLPAARNVVPDLRRVRQRETVEAKIRQAGLQPQITDVRTPDPPTLPVLLQCPAPGTRLGARGTVRVVFALAVGEAA